MTRRLLFVGCVVAIGCSASASPTPPRPAAPFAIEVPPAEEAEAHEVDTAAKPPADAYEIYPGVTVTEAWVDCRSEDECTIVEAGCCDHCNGGAITAVRREYAARAKALLAEVGCETPCSQTVCDEVSAHSLVCMTTACHIADLEEAVQDRIWGESPAEDDSVPTVVESN